MIPNIEKNRLIIDRPYFMFDKLSFDKSIAKQRLTFKEFEYVIDTIYEKV